MEKRYEIGMTFLTNINEMNSEALFVMTRKDIKALRREVEALASVPLSVGKAELFFKFENYPVVVAVQNIDRALWLVDKAEKWYSQFPDGRKFWVSVKEVKHG